jgi:hypothetical protein
MRPLVLLVVLAVAGSIACNKKSDAPDCKAAASSYAALVKQQIDRDTAAGDDAENRRAQALSLIPSLKDEMVKACEKNKWSEGTRLCIRNARAAADLPHCMPKKPEEAASAPATQEGAPAAPAPADPGKSGE